MDESESYSATAVALDFEDLPLGIGLGAGGAIFADAFAVQSAGNAKNDLPGRIREF